MGATWQLAQADLRCRIEHRNGQLLWQIEHPDAPDGRTRLAPVSDITVDHRPVQWTALLEAEEGSGPDGAPRLAVTLEDSSGRLRMVRHFELFRNHPFVRTWGVVERTGAAAPAPAGAEPPVIDGAAILHLALGSGEAENGVGPITLFHVEQFSWPYHKDFFSLRQIPLVPNLAPYELRMGSFPAHYHAPTSCAWASLRAGAPDAGPEDRGGGPGLVLGIEFNGKSRLGAWATSDAAFVESRIDALAHPLVHGEPFEIPACFVGCCRGDWDEAGFRTQRFAEDHVHPPMPDDHYPWVQYDSWAYGQEIDEAQQMAVIDRCAELGIEAFILDLGWARTIGDWRPDPAKFPRGLRPLAERAHSLGMKFGVHVAIAQMAPDAPAAREHPDWLAFGGNDYYGAGAICLGHAPARGWLIDSLVRLVREEGLDYIVQDGEDVVKRCTRADHTHAPGDSNYANSTTGLDQVIGAVRAAHPHLVWENCEDGGCMMTYRMARLCHTSITVDNIATYATRQGVYGASYPFSPRYSVRYMQDAPTAYTLRSASFGGPLIFMHRIGEWTPEQMADTRRAIAEYKRLRAVIRRARIVHLLPPAGNVEGLGRGWDAIGAVSLDGQRGVVMVYRAVGGPLRRTIRPRGLQAGASYRVRLVDAGEVAIYSAADLEEKGVDIALDELGSEIIELEMLTAD